MAISYQVEGYDECIEDAKGMFQAHYAEVGSYRDAELDVDFEAKEKIYRSEMGFIATARIDGRLIGYWAAIVRHHMHYKSVKVAVVDIYYIVPEHRGRAAIGLERFIRKNLKALGVSKIHTRTKTKDVNNASKFYEAVGYELIEYGYVLDI